MAKNENRCWPGYEPVKGKQQHEKGSCRPKADGKLTVSEKEFRGKRAKQLATWKKEHPASPIQAAQHLHKPDTSKAAKKTGAKKQAGASTEPSRKR